MLIKFYGARGSIPISNRSIRKYGGNTTCLYIETLTGNFVVVDSGTGVRELGLQLVKNGKLKINFLLTHYHWDHIQGFPFFVPIFFKDAVIEIYGPDNEVGVKKALYYQMSLPFFPTRLPDLPAKFMFKDLKNRFKIGNLQIQTMINNHPNYTKGLKFVENNKCVVFLTDNELFAKKQRTPYKNFVKFVKGADLLIHDAQYTEEEYKSKIGWGHSTCNQVMKLAEDSGVRHVIFTHHDPLHSDEFIDEMVQKSKEKYPNYKIEAAAEEQIIYL